MPAEQLSVLCGLAVGLCLTFFGLAVLPLRALPFALSPSVVQRRWRGAALPGLQGVCEPQGQGSRETA